MPEWPSDRILHRLLTQEVDVDIICPKCGEPWDMDCLHEEIAARLASKQLTARQIGTYPSGNIRYHAGDYQRCYNLVGAEFRETGCKTFTSYGAKCTTTNASDDAVVAAALYELLGDDLDAAASMLADYRQ